MLHIVKRLLLLLPILLFSIDENSTVQEEPLEVSSRENNESFLLDYEYGRMLYNNPRGIACNKCHGKEGLGGQKIAKYYDKHKNPKILKGLNITTYSFEELKESLKNRYRNKENRRVRHKIMPIYYLTDEEIKAIYTYLQEVRKKHS